MKKRGLLALILSLSLSLSLLVLTGCSDGRDTPSVESGRGLWNISADKTRNSSYKIEIQCNDYRECTISAVGDDEKAYYGEQLMAINSDLGTYRIKVHLFDCWTVDETFRETYKAWTTYELAGSGKNLRFMYAYTMGHGVLIYIGSDEPINSELLPTKRQDSISFTIKI